MRVLVVDGDEVVTVGLRFLLGRQPWVERCLHATEADGALGLARRWAPHVAVVGLGVADPPAAFGDLLRYVSPRTHLLLMGAGAGAGLPERVLDQAGAVGFVSRSWAVDELVAAIRVAAGGTRFAGRRATPAVLTGREEDVLARIALGETNSEIAGALNLSLYTIKQHASAAYRKLEARNRTEAVEHARRLGILA